MDRLACVDVPSLPLQLLLRREPEARAHPAAVVDRDHPQGQILWVNERARRLRVLPGLRYSAALSLAPDLRAGTVSAREIEAGVRQLETQLRQWSPEIEPARDEPGVCWVDASGLGRLYASPRLWGEAMVAALAREGFAAAVAVGFTRFGSYAVVRSRRCGVCVFADRREERRAALRVPLDVLAIEPALRERLDQLGVQRVGAFLRLPASGVRKRFGEEAHRLHRLAAGSLWAPFAPSAPEVSLRRHQFWDTPESDVHRLVFAVKRLLGPLLDELASRQEALCELELRLVLDRRGAVCTERVRTATPTLDALQILNLVQLRLAGLELTAGVVELHLDARARRVVSKQLDLSLGAPQRDCASADRALARLRAEFGEDCVLRAQLRNGHLPEACFAFERLERVPEAEPARVSPGNLVRRIRARPLPLRPRPRHEPDGWLLRGEGHGPVVRCSGPYVLSGGWWTGRVHREYHFAETRDGGLAWIYYDRRRQRWFLHGRVE
ncbi:MAG: DNA polymerase Y family protein [Proteobacteria bacterium]|nr:DNA polymerase Y family protein [Pseudomonadota bacterium]